MTNKIKYCVLTDSTQSPTVFRATPGIEKKSDAACDKYLSKDKKIEISIYKKYYGNTVRAYTALRNISGNTTDVTTVSSAVVEITNNGKRPWFSKGKYMVHYCLNCWLGEGQWRCSPLEDLGLYQTFDGHDNNSRIIFQSIGSWSTDKYFPIIIIEDTETLTMHYFELECGGTGWYIEIGTEINRNTEENLYIFASCMCEKNGGWHAHLEPGDEIKTPTAVFGSIDGGFDDAVAEIIKYKRKISKVKFKNDYPLVCFNNYMNASWADPSPKKILPLMNAAADLGAEIFCVDDGWFSRITLPNEKALGDWNINDEIFAPYGLSGIIEHAHRLGMRFGIWLEIEACAANADSYIKEDLLVRRGNIIGGSRAFLDFRRENVQNRIEKVFDKLYDMGVRYIKNDYNQSVGIGADGTESLSQSLIDNTNSFYAFIDRIIKKYPDLIIENCGSGAMRSDGETLSHFHLQSISDQEVYTCFPSILSGSLACIPPEKGGIWSYPYPTRFENRDIYAFTDKELDSFKDGKQTIFNMVNSMMGLMCMAGRPDAFDEFNTRLAKDAVAVYKSIRSDIPLSYPVYPKGTFRISDTGIQCFGLQNKNEMYLAVWQINDDNDNKEIDLSKYGQVSECKKLYPYLAEYNASIFKNGIKVTLPRGNTAALFKILFKNL